MKNNKLITAIASLIALVVISASCAKIDQFGNTNQNPNGITLPVTSALLTNVESQLGGFATNLRKSVYCQYVAENQYTDVSLFALPQLEMGGTYSGPLQDLQTIIDYNSDPKTAGAAAANGSNKNQIAIAKILKGYVYWILTDSWGDIPYSEALLGAANIAPKFDKQEDIYFAIMKDIKEATASFDGGGLIKGDIIYGGNIDNWKRLGNSIRMLMAMRLTKVYPAAGGKAALEFADAASSAGGYIDNNSFNWTLNYPGGNFKNPWYLTYESRDDYAESKTIGDILAGLGDTRQSVFGTNSVTFPCGLTRDLAVAFANSVGNGQARVLAASKRTESSPVVIIGASSVMLARAEAIERGWITGDAKATYNAGVAASFAQWGLDMPATYLTAGAANYDDGAGVPTNVGAGSAPYDNYRTASTNVQDAATSTKLKRIALQRWLAAFPNGNEGWSEWRRTSVPNLQGTRFATNASKQTVRRYVYGVNDYSFNNDAVKAAAALLTGGDTQDARMWWDKP